MSNPKNNWRTFNIAMPDVLKPTYDFLQEQLTNVLADDDLMDKIRQVDPTQKKGLYWIALRDIIKSDFSNWTLGANAWYARMLYENIRRLMSSGVERRTIHDALMKHDNKLTDAFWKDLHDGGFYPKHGVVRNVQREIANGSFTDVPVDARFNMDYSTVSDHAILHNVSKNRWLLRVDKTTWLDIEIILPKTARKQATGKLAKPRFVKRKSDDEYVGCISYEVKNDVLAKTKKILGVDLGIVKPFSAAALDSDGNVSSEYLISKRTQRLVDKYDRVNQSLGRLLDKQARCDVLTIKSIKYDRRADEIDQLRKKKRNLRTEIVRFIALDVVLSALNEKCDEIHLENLSWLDSRGGRWNHSEVQTAISELAPLFGLKVEKVNAWKSSSMSPFCEDEFGVERDREIVFDDGLTIDRDFLADVNLACRPVGWKKNKNDGDKKKVRRRRVNRASVESRSGEESRRISRRSYRRECYIDKDKHNQNIDYGQFFSGDADVVVFSAGVGGLPPARSVIRTANTNNIVTIKPGTS